MYKHEFWNMVVPQSGKGKNLNNIGRKRYFSLHIEINLKKMQIDELKKKILMKKLLNELSLDKSYDLKYYLRHKMLERDIFIASKEYFTFPVLIKSSFLQQTLTDC